MRNLRPTLRKVTWDEFKTRTAQLIRKNADLARHRAGVAPPLFQLDLSRPARGNFFFSIQDVPSIVDALRERLPATVHRIVERADGICEHRFRLLGQHEVGFGSDIDWHLDPVHGKRAPLLPWFKIPFLDFAVVGDHKIIWELNRHQHLVTLAKAWILTRDQKYATELIRQWHSWNRTNPYPIGINWASSLEVAFRSLSWLWVRALLSSCPGYNEDLDQELVQRMGLHAAHIERYLSTYFSPNTHLIGEAVALFFIGTLCPQLKRAKSWQDTGLRIILREAKRQVRPDGSYFEQSLYYHVYALDFFLHLRQLANRNGIYLPTSFDSILSRMLDFLKVLSQAGPPESFGDDDGGRVFDPERNQTEHLIDPLATGALALDRNDLRQRARLTEESVWLFGGRAAATLPLENPGVTDLKSSAFDAAGIYVTASSDLCTQQMVIDAGNMGMGRGGHGHADALSITMCLNRRRWLIDSGTYRYLGAEPERDRFRGTAAHNTLVVDGLHQAVPEGPFRWRAQPKTQTETWVTGRTFSLFAANHAGYCRLPDPVLHRRFVFHLYGRFWLVRDVVEGHEEHDLQVYWHFAPDLKVVPAAGAFIASLGEDDATESTRIALIFSGLSAWRHEAGSHEVSPAYGLKQHAPVVVARTRTRLPVECATGFIPLLSQTAEPGALEKLPLTSSELTMGVQAYRYDSAETSCFIVFSDRRESWDLGFWESDASFLCCTTRNEEITHLAICNGSFAKLFGNPIFTSSRCSEQFECWREGSTFRVISPDEKAVSSFCPAVFEDFRSVNS